MPDTQGKFCKAEARETRAAVKELFEAIAKTKRSEFLGHLNDIYLFLNAAEAAAPEKVTP
jgi:hypothetical protein